MAVATWKGVKTLGESPSKRSAHTAVIYGEEMFVFGGFDGNGELNDLFSFNLVSHKWDLISPKEIAPAPRRYHSAVVYGNRMYIFGGCSQHQLLSDIYYFDFDTRAWEKVEDFGKRPPPRFGHCALVHKNRMYIFGGYGDENAKADLYFFDLDTRMWYKVRTTGTPPTSRVYASAVLYREQIWIFGGKSQSKESSVFLNDIYAYTFETRSWRKVESKNGEGASTEGSSSSGPGGTEDPNVPSPRAGHTALLFKNSMIVFGGSDKKRYFNDSYRFNLDTLSWSELNLGGHPPKKRSGHAAVLDDTQMLVFGGPGFNDLFALQLEAAKFSVKDEEAEMLERLEKLANERNQMRQQMKEAERKQKEAEERLALKVKEEERLRRRLETLESKFEDLRIQLKTKKTEQDSLEQELKRLKEGGGGGVTGNGGGGGGPAGGHSSLPPSPRGSPRASPRVLTRTHSSSRNNNPVSPLPLASSGSGIGNYAQHSGIEIQASDLEVNWDNTPIGKGAQSVYYRGLWRGIDCAIKKLDNKAVSPQQLAVLQEAATLMEMGHHPNIVQMFGTFRGPQNELCVVIELALYRSLHDLMKNVQSIEGGGPRLLDIIEMTLGAAKGLRYLHTQKIAHGNINSKNVLVTGRWTAVISDFMLTSSITGGEATANAKMEEDVRQFGLMLQELFTKTKSKDAAVPANLASQPATSDQFFSLVQGCPQQMSKLIHSCLTDPKITLRQVCDQLRACRQQLYTEVVREVKVGLSRVGSGWRNSLAQEAGLSEHQIISSDYLAHLLYVIQLVTGRPTVPTSNGSVYLTSLTSEEASKVQEALKHFTKTRQQVVRCLAKVHKISFKEEAHSATPRGKWPSTSSKSKPI